MLVPETRLRERYRILHKIGGGGFGYVYRAIDEVFGCSVAIKETREEVANLDKLRKAFEREAKLLRNLKHNSLPRVTDYFFQDNAQFLVMDFIEGEDLAARLEKRLQQNQGPFTCEELLPWADKILAALEYLHSLPEPIIHRDIKPANIKLTDEGDVYLLDFGLAKGSTGQMSTIIEGQPTSTLLAFTREYAPLEQLQGSATEPQSDIYAFGATLYHLLTGQLPAPASQRDDALQRGQRDPLQPAHELNPAIPHAISRIISQALIVRWWERMGSAREMRAALERARKEMAAIPPVYTTQPLSPAAPPVASDQLATLPFPQSHTPPSLQNTGSEPHGKNPTRGHNTPRVQFIIIGLALALLVSLTAVLRLTFPHWFAPAVSTNNATQEIQSPEKPQPPQISTPQNLKQTQTLRGHEGRVWSVAFSPDGSLAASASMDKTIILWDTKTWTHKFPPLTGHAHTIYSVAFSPDGKILASGSHDASIRLWDPQTGKLIAPPLPLEDPRKRVLRVTFSPDGNYLASCSGINPKDGGEEIRLWEARNGWKSKVLEGKIKRVFAIAFSPDGSTLASAGLDNKLRLWNLRSDKLIREESVNQPLITLAFSKNGDYLASGSEDTTIKLWLYRPQTQSWEETTPLGKIKQEHKNYITSIAFSPDNKTLVSASFDNTIRVWDITARTSKPLSVSKAKVRAPHWSVAFSPDGQTLIAGGQDKIVRVWQ